MREGNIPTRLIVAGGLVAWAGIILLPLLVLYSPVLFSAPKGGESQVMSLVWPSIRLAGIIAGAAVLLGYIPGRILGTSHRRTGPLLFLFLMPLMLPRYVLYYAWTLLLCPTNAIGKYLSGNLYLARTVGAATSWIVMMLWYWPLAALLIAQGWRMLDKEVQDSSRLETGGVQQFFKITLPMLAGPLILAFSVCFAFCLAEFGTFHLAGVRTIGTELAVLYELTGSEGSVARAAWPIAIVGLVLGLVLWRKSRDWSVNPPTDRVEFRSGNWRWFVLTGLIGLSLVVPTGLLIGNISGLGPLRQFLTLHLDGLFWSLVSAVGAGGAGMLIASGALALDEFGKIGRLFSMVVHSTIFLAMFLPGSVVAVAILKVLGVFAFPQAFRQGWYVVSAGQAARFSGIALILLRLARDARERHLGEMASVDGANKIKAWFYVHLPRTWPTLLGAFLVVVMFSITELSASMVLLPPGLPSFAQRLLNQMHYARDQHVIASCLVLLVGYLSLSGVVVALLKLVRTRGVSILILCAIALGISGCSAKPGASGHAKVLDAFGKIGRGKCEFIYPRAIDLSPDGSLFVVDKTGVIQRLTRKGAFLGAIKMPLTEAGKPTGLSVGPDGNLYVADTHYHRVMVFTPDGKLLRQFGRFGQGPGEFIYPTDVAFSDDGRIFVSEYGGNDRISVFSFQGDFLYTFGGHGDGTGELARPSALCVDQQRGRLYVADACNHRIGVYTLDGQLRGYIGSVGRNRGQLRYPYDLALLDDGRLVVCEYGNNRIQVFSPEGKSLETYGQPGRELGQLAYPWGVTTDKDRKAYIVDTGNNRVQVWQL